MSLSLLKAIQLLLLHLEIIVASVSLFLLHPDGQMDSQIYVRWREKESQHWSSYCEMLIFPLAPSTFALRKSKRKSAWLAVYPSVCLLAPHSAVQIPPQFFFHYNNVREVCVLVQKWRTHEHKSKQITNPNKWKNVFLFVNLLEALKTHFFGAETQVSEDF